MRVFERNFPNFDRVSESVKWMRFLSELWELSALLSYSNNGKDTSGIGVHSKFIWLQSIWDASGISRYAFSTDGKSYQTFGRSYQLTWGSYRGDRIGIFNFNRKEDKGYIDVDWFRYDYSN